MYQNFFVVGDFNLNEAQVSLQNFIYEFSLENIVEEPTCFKSHGQNCNDLTLTSDTEKLSKVKVIETRLSDFHAMVATALRGSFHKKGPRVTPTTIVINLITSLLEKKLKSNNNAAVMDILDKQEPLKKKYLRANDGPFNE